MPLVVPVKCLQRSSTLVTSSIAYLLTPKDISDLALVLGHFLSQHASELDVVRANESSTLFVESKISLFPMMLSLLRNLF